MSGKLNYMINFPIALPPNAQSPAKNSQNFDSKCMFPSLMSSRCLAHFQRASEEGQAG